MGAFNGWDVEMPSNKGMTCLGQMETMTETWALKRAIFMRLAEKQEKNVPHFLLKQQETLMGFTPSGNFPLIHRKDLIRHCL